MCLTIVFTHVKWFAVQTEIKACDYIYTCKMTAIEVTASDSSALLTYFNSYNKKCDQKERRIHIDGWNNKGSSLLKCNVKIKDWY